MRARTIGMVASVMLLALVGIALSVTAVRAAPEGVGVWFQDEDDDGVNAFCANPDLTHPVGWRLSTRYDVTYEEVMAWFCNDEMGFGQISLALQTAAQTGDSPQIYLDRRIAGEGWGEIWQDVGKPGRGPNADKTRQGGGPPPWAGQEEGEEDGEGDDAGGGPPPWAGPRDQRDPNAEKPGNGPKKSRP